MLSGLVKDAAASTTPVGAFSIRLPIATRSLWNCIVVSSVNELHCLQHVREVVLELPLLSVMVCGQYFANTQPCIDMHVLVSVCNSNLRMLRVNTVIRFDKETLVWQCDM